MEDMKAVDPLWESWVIGQEEFGARCRGWMGEAQGKMATWKLGLLLGQDHGTEGRSK